jgi:hypothetical protein
MDYDDLRRAKLTSEVSANIESSLTLSLALRAAARFSEGAVVTEGEGLLGKTAKGTFNICYWVRVEGLPEQWVVRFPLVGMVPMDMMTAKFSGEIATLRFLREKTSVRVPRLIGYSLGDEDISIPFMITQNVPGLPLTIYWSRFGKHSSCVDRILDSLAQQYLELLSHPFDRIGSLRLTPDGKSWEIGTSPISVDQFDTSRDGLKITLSKPHTTSLDYYVSQTHLFKRYTNEQRNSVCDEQDAILKYITPEVFRRVIPHFNNDRFNCGPFFLFHLDLHPTNVITNNNWEVEAILDWEFASALPIEVAFSPPRCIMDQYRANEMHTGSDNYNLYESRLRIFTKKIENHLVSSYSNLSQLAPVILTQLRGALPERRAFFAWSASDIRNMFDLLWSHLALTTPIAIESEDDVPTTENVVFETEQELVNVMLQTMSEKGVKEWMRERLMLLHEYVLERDSHARENPRTNE